MANELVISQVPATIPALRDFSAYLQAIRKFPLLSETEENLLANNYRKTGNLRSAHALVCAHLRQVVAVARTYDGYGLNQHDLVQEGNIGLMTAVKKFDPDKGVRLNAYALYWIRSCINEYVIKNWRIVKVATTRAQRKLFYKLRNMTRQLGSRLTGPEISNISTELEVSKKDVVQMHSRMNNFDVPFEVNNQDDDEIRFAPADNLVADEGRHADIILMEQNEQQIRHQKLQTALTKLNPRELKIIKARALSESGKDTTLADLAKQLGVSSERVRQLETKAMKKLHQLVLDQPDRLVNA